MIKKLLTVAGIVLLGLTGIVVAGIIVFVCLMESGSSKSYEELAFKTKNDIAALTEIAEFPEIEYLKHSHDNWEGHTWTEHKFQDTNSVDGLIREIVLKIASEENVYWRKDSLQGRKTRSSSAESMSM